MTSPNYEAMTTKQLRTYVLQHRDDQNAINALANRVEANGIKLDSPEQLPNVIRRPQSHQE
ncbi:DUF6887 family protein [Halotia branconii]|uniref:Uncharacterized protein n=1 Tax=Halotia branconii CENA392 TaxID=1539056 RepID=A0AAJ6PBH1_9CYAN|nr:hypothetical protein [Halotia branconii]WGV27840.1 hypothetical protein QI031_10300 [Halotia branconii CENA392]